MTTHTTSSPDQGQVLYRHQKCPQWGLAVLAWEHEDKRGYQFEDGNMRVFKRGFYKLLEDVEPPADRTRRVLEHLNRALGRTEAMERASTRNLTLIPFSAQVAYFKGQHPEGFSAEPWQKTYRGRGARRSLKRHRDRALTLAQERLGRDSMVRLLARQNYEGVNQALIEVLEQTNLVSPAKRKPLATALPYQQQIIALALGELLHGEGELGPRFDRFVNSLTRPSWELATAPLALLYPQEHICVKPSVFTHQALWVVPRLSHTRTPQASTYLHYLKMARIMIRDLRRAGVPPADLMDVHDFIDLTLRPSTREKLAEASREQSALGASPRQGGDEAAESDREAA